MRSLLGHVGVELVHNLGRGFRAATCGQDDRHLVHVAWTIELLLRALEKIGHVGTKHHLINRVGVVFTLEAACGLRCDC